MFPQLEETNTLYSELTFNLHPTFFLNQENNVPDYNMLQRDVMLHQHINVDLHFCSTTE